MYVRFDVQGRYVYFFGRDWNRCRGVVRIFVKGWCSVRGWSRNSPWHSHAWPALLAIGGGYGRGVCLLPPKAEAFGISSSTIINFY